MGSELKDDQPSGAAEENSTGKAKRNKVLAEGKDMTYANGTVKDKAKITGPTEAEVQSTAGAKTRRRSHSSKYKLQVLSQLDCSGSGGPLTSHLRQGSRTRQPGHFEPQLTI